MYKIWVKNVFSEKYMGVHGSQESGLKSGRHVELLQRREQWVGEGRDNYEADSALTSSREMGTFGRIPPCCEGITEVRTAIRDHLRHPAGILPNLTWNAASEMGDRRAVDSGRLRATFVSETRCHFQTSRAHSGHFLYSNALKVRVCLCQYFVGSEVQLIAGWGQIPNVVHKLGG